VHTVTISDSPRPAGTGSTADLVSQAAAQISTLVRDEVALAKAELAEKGKRAGGAAVLAWFGLALLVTLAVVVLDLVWPLWLSILVVMIVVFAAAGVAALLGKKQLDKSSPLVPEKTIASVEADIETVKSAAHRGRHA
jgi:uncharacterized membrane protein YqjE